jgi:hypothetical protein
VIKSKWMKCARHVACIVKTAYKMSAGKPEKRRPFGRPTDG